MQLHLTGAGRDASTERSDEGRNPHHQMYLKSSMDLPANLMLDLMGRYVDSLPSINVPSYVAVDARVSWAPRKDLELSIVGRNLLDSQHPEFAPSFVRSTMAEIERSVFAKVKWKF